MDASQYKDYGNYQRIPPVWRRLTHGLKGTSGQTDAGAGLSRSEMGGLPNAARVFILLA
jgi:hypothetical protein